MCVRYTLHKSDAALAAVAKAIGQMYRRPAWLVDRYNIRISEVAPVFAEQKAEMGLPRLFGQWI